MNYKLETLNVLKTIVKENPTQLLSTHLSIALADYSNFDSISDKELYFIFEKYHCEKELDITPQIIDEDIYNIEEEEEDLFSNEF